MPHNPGDKDAHTMSIVLFVLFCVVVGFFVSLLIRISLKKRKKNTKTLFPESPVVVTSATHTAPGGYPVTQMPATGYQPAMYAPYPLQSGAPNQMPMPMPMHVTQPPAPGMHPYTAPYPPMPAPATTMNPPSYDMAVAGGSAGQPNNASYEKQSPYNPSYTAH